MKYLCHYLAFINIVDGFATYIGISGQFIQEANPIMRSIYELGPIYFLLIKLSLSIVLYLLLYFNKVPDYKLLKQVTAIGSLFYTVVIGLHTVWIFNALT